MKEGLHRISRLANIGYYEWNATSDGYEDVSIEFAALFGLSREAFLKDYRDRNVDMHRWTHPDDIQRYNKNDKYYDENPQTYSIEYRVFGPNGEVRYVVETAEPEWDDNGIVVRWFGIIQDITDRVHEEQQREAVLRKAVASAEKANQAKTEFLASMSHELRTPLNAIMGFGHLLAHDPRNQSQEDRLDYASHVLESGEHLLSLVDQVLDLAAIEARNLPMQLTDVSVKVAIDECLSMLLATARERRISLLFDGIDEKKLLCRADRGLLRQILLNLLTNAIKYNIEGGSVRVSVQSVVDEKGMPCIRVTISDTGKGIPDDKQFMVFEPFNRLGLDTSNIRGTGIGLTIVKQLAKRMSGAVGFTSSVGIGSEFWIDLPAATSCGSPSSDSGLTE